RRGPLASRQPAPSKRRKDRPRASSGETSAVAREEVAMTRFKRSTLALLAFVAGWACGGGGSDGIAAVMRLLELGGASLADMLAQAGPPPISAGLGIAEIVPDDGTRHFALTVASENRSSKEDTAALYALMDGHGPI